MTKDQKFDKELWKAKWAEIARQLSIDYPHVEEATVSLNLAPRSYGWLKYERGHKWLWWEVAPTIYVKRTNDDYYAAIYKLDLAYQHVGLKCLDALRARLGELNSVPTNLLKLFETKLDAMTASRSATASTALTKTKE